MPVARYICTNGDCEMTKNFEGPATRDLPTYVEARCVICEMETQFMKMRGTTTSGIPL